MTKQVAKSTMAQTKDLKPTEVEKPTYRFPDWLLFAVSVLAILFSPFGFFGLFIGIFAVMQNVLLSWTLEVILFVVGFIPFAILASRRKYALIILLVIFAIIDIGVFYFVYWFFVALSET